MKLSKAEADLRDAQEKLKKVPPKLAPEESKTQMIA